MNTFPRQDIAETDKDKKFHEQCINFIIDRFNNKNNHRLEKIHKNYRRYNGEIDEASIKYLTNTYGKKNLGKFLDYRLSRPKLDQLYGEFMTRPLNSTVTTINREAKSKKLEKISFYKGLMSLKKSGTLDKIQQENPNIEILNGISIPEAGSPEAEQLLNIKEENEKAMQIALNQQIQQLGIKYKFGFNFVDLLITAEAHTKVYMDEKNKIVCRPIKAADAIFEEIDDDIFLEKTPYYGERRFMYLHQIMSEYGKDLKEEEKKLLSEIEGDWKNYVNNPSFYGSSHNYYKEQNGILLIEVYEAEWKSVRPMFEKLISREGNEPLKKFMSAENYEKNKKKIDKDVAKGKYKIEKSWQIDIRRCIKIGHNIYLNWGRKPYQIQIRETGCYEPKYSYIGLLFNTKENIRVSIVDMLENLSFLYNVVMFQIARELAKAKGKAIVYDRAFLPKGMTMKEVLYGIANDGIIDINSAADGNRYQRELVINGQMKEIDLGVSNTIQILLPLKAEIKRMADEITGINAERQGQIAASSTATNAQSSIMASRTITEPLFMHFNKFIENTLMRICNYTKISWFEQESEEGEIILGTQGIETFEKTRDWSDDDYGVHLSDGGRENEIRKRIEQLAETSLNAKELRYQDVIGIYLSESLIEAKQLADKGWTEIQRIAGERQAQAEQAAAERTQMQQETQLQLAKENREDIQAHEIELTKLKLGIEQVNTEKELELEAQLNQNNNNI